MALNGLGFNESRLYFYSNFFIGLPTESLLGDGISPSSLNDDTLSRTLDAIFDYGPTELFNELALQAMNKNDRGNASTTCGHDKLFDVWKVRR